MQCHEKRIRDSHHHKNNIGILRTPIPGLGKTNIIVQLLRHDNKGGDYLLFDGLVSSSIPESLPSSPSYSPTWIGAMDSSLKPTHVNLIITSIENASHWDTELQNEFNEEEYLLMDGDSLNDPMPSKVILYVNRNMKSLQWISQYMWNRVIIDDPCNANDLLIKGIKGKYAWILWNELHRSTMPIHLENSNSPIVTTPLSLQHMPRMTINKYKSSSPHLQLIRYMEDNQLMRINASIHDTESNIREINKWIINQRNVYKSHIHKYIMSILMPFVTNERNQRQKQRQVNTVLIVINHLIKFITLYDNESMYRALRIHEIACDVIPILSSSFVDMMISQGIEYNKEAWDIMDNYHEIHAYIMSTNGCDAFINDIIKENYKKTPNTVFYIHSKNTILNPFFNTSMSSYINHKDSYLVINNRTDIPDGLQYRTTNYIIISTIDPCEPSPYLMGLVYRMNSSSSQPLNIQWIYV